MDKGCVDTLPGFDGTGGCWNSDAGIIVSSRQRSTRDLEMWRHECSNSCCPSIGFPGCCRFAVVATLPLVGLHPAHAGSLGLCMYTIA